MVTITQNTHKLTFSAFPTLGEKCGLNSDIPFQFAE